MQYKGTVVFITISTFHCAHQVHQRELYLKNKKDKEAKDGKTDQREWKGEEDTKEGNRRKEKGRERERDGRRI